MSNAERRAISGLAGTPIQGDYNADFEITNNGSYANPK
jgi:hypothetical protein